MKKIKLLRNCRIDGKERDAGDVVELDDNFSDALVKEKFAVVFVEAPPPQAGNAERKEEGGPGAGAGPGEDNKL